MSNFEITSGGVFLIIVFGVIIIIWAVSKLIKPSDKKDTGEISGIAKASPAVKLDAVSNIETETEINLNESEKNEESEEELIAVITAAIAMIINECNSFQKPVSGFNVVSFKKRSNWK